MHDNIKDWLQQSEIRIAQVNSVSLVDNKIHAVITTKQFGQYKTKPYEFGIEEFGEIIERGYV